ncbi:MAG: nucleotide exchange factor GrpE [Euryarchaeota archaeon]|nr:nucleotide exchange factor GrpE [Euryarchaeota archaeon]
MTDSEIEESGVPEVDVVEGADADTGAESLQALKERLTECEEKADSHFDRLQRLQADFANYKKRTAKETIESIEYANESLILSILDVVDNLERAIDSIQQDPDVDHIKKGIEMILRQFHDVLEKEEVFPIESVGKAFDPYMHETIARVKCDSESGTIVEELQRGYRFKSKVIRPCMVKVAE